MSGKSFRFSLEPVLRLRKHETESARRQLERAVAARHEAERIVADAEHILSDRVRRLVPPGSNGTAIQRMSDFREEARQKLEAARRRLHEMRLAEEQARSRLVERRREEETLQQLRESEKEGHDREVHAAETALIDEQALNGYMRKNPGQQR